MTDKQPYALVRKTSPYYKEGVETPFPVSLNPQYTQLADGFYIRGGAGGNYRPEDLDFYIKSNDEYVLVERKRWVI